MQNIHVGFLYVRFDSLVHIELLGFYPPWSFTPLEYFVSISHITAIYKSNFLLLPWTVMTNVLLTYSTAFTCEDDRWRDLDSSSLSTYSGHKMYLCLTNYSDFEHDY